MKKALVLGGGGSVGIAWEIGMLAGMLDGGLDVRDADLIVGTSAGSVVGAHLALGRDARDLLREQRDFQPPATADAPEPDTEGMMAVFRAWTSAERMTQEHCAEVGRLALKTRTRSEEQWLAGFAANGWSAWPKQVLLVAAVDCESGALKMFSSADGVPLDRAVAASCSVPGMFPPVTIDGHRYTDGGVRSCTSAEIAASIEPDVVLILAPIGRGERGIHALAARDIPFEVAQLEAAGASVQIIMMDDAAHAAGGANMMDAAARFPTMEAAEAHGRRLAPELAKWWRASDERIAKMNAKNVG